MNKFTKGPWEVLTLVDCGEVRAKGCVIADIHCGDFSMGGGNAHDIRIEECRANTNLIASAPDMREGLEEAIYDICRLCKRLNPQHENCTGCKDIEPYQEIIKKADGEL